MEQNLLNEVTETAEIVVDNKFENYLKAGIGLGIGLIAVNLTFKYAVKPGLDKLRKKINKKKVDEAVEEVEFTTED